MNVLLISFLLLIPTQLGRHWWPDWSVVMGSRMDYLSPTLYLTDLVWMGWVLSQIPKHKSQGANKIQDPNNKIQTNTKRWVLAGVGLILVNMWVAENRWAAGYGWLRIIQWAITIVLVKNEKFRIKNILRWIGPAWVAFEVGLGLMQVFGGSSIQGIFYWLGERKIEINTIGAATWSVAGREMLRAYGTFSHPNSMAGFLGLVWILNWTRKKKDWGWWLITILGAVGIVVCGSRTVVVVVLGMVVMMGLGEWIKSKSRAGLVKVMAGLVITMVMAGWMGNGSIAGWDKAGVGKRWELNKTAVEMIKDNPVWGVGVNNYLIKLPSYWNEGRIWLQPVHNIILLMVSEVGVVGMVPIYLLVKSQIIPPSGTSLRFANSKKQITRNKLEGWRWAVIFVLVTGMVDHYWITLAQNRWLLAVILGLI